MWGIPRPDAAGEVSHLRMRVPFVLGGNRGFRVPTRRGKFRLRASSFCLRRQQGIPRPDAGPFLHRQKGAKKRLGFRPDGFRIRLQPLGRAPQTPELTGAFIFGAVYYDRLLQL